MVEPGEHLVLAEAKIYCEQADVSLTFLPAFQFLISRKDFADWAGDRDRLLMETHYRRIREEFNILINADGEPEGGQWNFDAENRRTIVAYREDPNAKPSAVPAFEPDETTRKVIADVNRLFPEAPGRTEDFRLPVCRADALTCLQAFIEQRLARFGDYQDLMIEGEPTLYHSMLSPVLNIGLLLPMECVKAVLQAYAEGKAPISAVEGFVRQIIGWREFVNGVYWLRMPGYAEGNSLGAERSLPAFFNNGKTDMHCVQKTLEQAHNTGYNHHIQRLMILGNFMLLAGVKPKEAIEWFAGNYVDSHDWVMMANVMGMALHADGGFVATKPYAASASYISKMSNYCEGCCYDPEEKYGKKACPFNVLYWAFYDRHQDRFVKNPRTSNMIRGWRKRREPERKKIVQQAEKFLKGLETV